MTILIAYDGRESTERALDYAIRHSVNYNEPLYILTVVTKDQMDPESPDPAVREYMEAARDRAAAEGAVVHTIIETGKPDETVLETASRFKCDTIIVGRSDKSALDRFILGSVSNYIVKNATCTVILVSDQDE
ncbi:MAG: universal stress protein [Candidatus Methanomethylophilaceae archaeon]|nr:universal stress protein [Candidatus Methanomethylophilaceae archaeon]